MDDQKQQMRHELRGWLLKEMGWLPPTADVMIPAVVEAVVYAAEKGVSRGDFDEFFDGVMPGNLGTFRGCLLDWARERAFPSPEEKPVEESAAASPFEGLKTRQELESWLLRASALAEVPSVSSPLGQAITDTSALVDQATGSNWSLARFEDMLGGVLNRHHLAGLVRHDMFHWAVNRAFSKLASSPAEDVTKPRKFVRAAPGSPSRSAAENLKNWASAEPEVAVAAPSPLTESEEDLKKVRTIAENDVLNPASWYTYKPVSDIVRDIQALAKSTWGGGYSREKFERDLSVYLSRLLKENVMKCRVIDIENRAREIAGVPKPVVIQSPVTGTIKRRKPKSGRKSRHERTAVFDFEYSGGVRLPLQKYNVRLGQIAGYAVLAVEDQNLGQRRDRYRLAFCSPEDRKTWSRSKGVQMALEHEASFGKTLRQCVTFAVATCQKHVPHEVARRVLAAVEKI